MKLSQKIGAALALCGAAVFVPSLAGARSVPAAIHTLAVQAAQPPTVPTGPYDERGWLDRFYAPPKYAPAWNPSTAATALYVLRRAKLQGLNPLDYGAESLQLQLRSGEADTARFDVALTSAMLQYLADLRVGRVRSEYHTRLPDPRLRQYDPVERLPAGLAAGRLQAAGCSAGGRAENPAVRAGQGSLGIFVASCPSSPIRRYRNPVLSSCPAPHTRP